MLLTNEMIQPYVNEGLVRSGRHATLPLTIYKYTPLCVYSQAWNYITSACRGIVISDDGRVVSRPYNKFFNYGERPLEEIPVGLDYDVYDKLDGSLITLSWFDGLPIVTSSGSFTSDHVGIAKALFENRYKDQLAALDTANTYMFELLHPTTRILVDYGTQEDLILTGIRNTDTGEELKLDSSFGFPTAHRYEGSTLESIVQESETNHTYENREGYIVRFSSGYRVKIKFSEYCRLNSIMSGMNPKQIWNMLYMKEVHGLPGDIPENIPDEMFNWMKSMEREFRQKYRDVEDKAREKLDEAQKALPFGADRKALAVVILGYGDPWAYIMFKMLDRKGYHKAIWGMLEPEGRSGFDGLGVTLDDTAREGAPA